MFRVLRSILPAVLGLIAATLVPAGATAHPPHGHGEGHHAGETRCTCPEARATDGWCAACATGYIAALPVPSAGIYEVLDPHGHDVDPGAMRCAGCRTAYDADGWCGEHAIGFSERRAYVSRLAWLLASADPVDPPSLSCAACREHGRTPGWCDSCGRGIVGGRALSDRERFDAAVAELGRVTRALQLAERCELCGVASFMNGRCPRCNVHYRDGRPVEVQE